jgi:putative spermidine/putrescine transport system permease protein
MTDSTISPAVPSAEARWGRAGKGIREPSPAGRFSWRGLTPWLGAAPFFLFVTVFLIVPILVNVWISLHDAQGGLTLATLAQLGESQYLSAFGNSIWLSAVTTILGGLLGLIIAWALSTIERPRWLRSLMLSFTVVASQQGGIPLAYAFIATIGAQGLVTVWLRDLLGFELPSVLGVSSMNGLVLVYLYFQAPLMAVLVLPAVMGIRKEWRESAVVLGASRIRYLANILFPILAPAVTGALLLLFANAFAAYATAYALAGSSISLVPVLIGFFISGNVLADPTLGAALVTGMLAVVSLAMLGRILLMRRSTRWLR